METKTTAEGMTPANRPIKLANGQFWMQRPDGCWYMISESMISHGIYWDAPTPEEWGLHRKSRRDAYQSDQGPDFDPMTMLDMGPAQREYESLSETARFRAFEDFFVACADSAGQ